MSNHTKSLNETAIISLLHDLDTLGKAVRKVKDGLLRIFPAKYGSDLWWEKSDEEAIRQIKAGKGITIKNKEELQKFLEL